MARSLSWIRPLAVVSLAFATSIYAQEPKEKTPSLPPTIVEARPAPPTNSPLAPLLGPDTVLTPNRGPSLTREFGGSVSVLTGEQIANTQQPYLRDILNTLPGVDIIQNGGPGRVSSAFLRGASSRATKVLLDGIPLNDPSSPQRTFDFGNFNTLEIDRVEVLRGPQSVLYGSDAVGGVINIITKRGDGPPQLMISNSYGGYSTFDHTTRASGGNDQFYYAFGVSYFDQTGFNASNTRYGRFFNVEKDPSRQTTLASRFGWTPDPNFDIDVVLRYLRADAKVDSFNQAPFDIVTDDSLARNSTDQFYGRVGARLALFDGFFENRVAYNYANINRDAIDPNGFSPDPSLSHGTTQKFEYQAIFNLANINKLTLGFDYQTEAFDNPPTQVRRRSINDSAVYVQDQISLWERWFTTVGVRHDEYELAGPATTWRVASIYHLKETGTAFHGAYGTGFIAPSLFEQFASLPPFVFGNPNLRPERSRGFEFGVEQAFADRKLVVDLTYFRTDFENLIQYVFPTYMNVNSARASGFEASATLQLTDTTKIIANYTNTATIDEQNNRPLQLRPRNKGSVTLNQSLLDGKANWYLQVLAVGDRNDYGAPANLRRVSPYAVVNTSVSYDVRPNVRLFARVDNLFDAKYEEVVGYNTPRASIFGGVKITFGGK